MRFRVGTWIIPCAVLTTVIASTPGGMPPTSEGPVVQAPSPVDEGPLVGEGAPADLALVYTGGVAGYVEPCG